MPITLSSTAQAWLQQQLPLSNTLVDALISVAGYSSTACDAIEYAAAHNIHIHTTDDFPSWVTALYAAPNPADPNKSTLGDNPPGLWLSTATLQGLNSTAVSLSGLLEAMTHEITHAETEPSGTYAAAQSAGMAGSESSYIIFAASQEASGWEAEYAVAQQLQQAGKVSVNYTPLVAHEFGFGDLSATPEQAYASIVNQIITSSTSEGTLYYDQAVKQWAAAQLGKQTNGLYSNSLEVSLTNTFTATPSQSGLSLTLPDVNAQGTYSGEIDAAGNLSWMYTANNGDVWQSNSLQVVYASPSSPAAYLTQESGYLGESSTDASGFFVANASFDWAPDPQAIAGPPNSQGFLENGAATAVTLNAAGGDKLLSLTQGANIGFGSAVDPGVLTFSQDTNTGYAELTTDFGDSIEAPSWTGVTATTENGNVNLAAAAAIAQSGGTAEVSVSSAVTLTGNGTTTYFAQAGDTISDPNLQGTLQLPFQLASCTGDPATGSMMFTGTNGQTVTVLNWFVPGNVPMQGGVVDSTGNILSAYGATYEATWQTATADNQTLVGFSGFDNHLSAGNYSNVTLIGPTGPGSTTTFSPNGNNTLVTGYGTVNGPPAGGSFTVSGDVSLFLSHEFVPLGIEDATIGQSGSDMVLSWASNSSQVVIQDGFAGSPVTVQDNGFLFSFSYSTDQLIENSYLRAAYAEGASYEWDGLVFPNGDTYQLPLASSSLDSSPVYGDPTPIPVGDSPPFYLSSEGLTTTYAPLSDDSTVSSVTIAGVLQSQTFTLQDGVIVKGSLGPGAQVNIYGIAGLLGTFAPSTTPPSIVDPITGITIQAGLTSSGSLQVTTIASDGSNVTTSQNSAGQTLSTKTSAAGLTVYSTVAQPNGNSTTQYFAPDGVTVLSTRNQITNGSYTLTTVASDGTIFVSHYSPGGVLTEQDISEPQDTSPIKLFFSPGQVASITLPTSDTLLSTITNADGSKTATVRHANGSTSVIASYPTGTGSILNLDSSGNRTSGFVIWGGASSTYSYNSTGAFIAFCTATSGRITTTDVGQPGGTYSEADYDSGMAVLMNATGIDNGQGTATWIQSGTQDINEEDFAPNGDVTYLTYDSTGRLTSKQICNAAGYATYEYQLNGDNSSYTSWSTDSGVSIETKYVDAQGILTDYRYTAGGALASTTTTQLDGSYVVTFADGAELTSTPTQGGGQTLTVADAGRDWAILTLDASGNLIAGSAQSASGSGQLTETDTATGVETFYQWNTDGSFSQSNTAIPPRSVTINANGSLTTATGFAEESGYITETRSSTGVLLSDSAVYGSITVSRAYQTDGATQTTLSDDLGETATFTTDGSGNLISASQTTSAFQNGSWTDANGVPYQASWTANGFTLTQGVSGSQTSIIISTNGTAALESLVAQGPTWKIDNPVGYPSGSYEVGQSGVNPGAPGSTVQYFNSSNVLLASTTISSTGEAVTNTYNAAGAALNQSQRWMDGSVELTTYNSDGSTTTAFTDAAGDTATAIVAANGTPLSGSFTAHTGASANSAGVLSNSSETDSSGNITTRTWYANGGYTSVTETPAAALVGTINLNAAGDLQVSTYNSDGSVLTGFRDSNGDTSAVLVSNTGAVESEYTSNTEIGFSTNTDVSIGGEVSVRDWGVYFQEFSSVPGAAASATTSLGVLQENDAGSGILGTAGAYSSSSSNPTSLEPYYQAPGSSTASTTNTNGYSGQATAVNATGQVAGFLTENGTVSPFISAANDGTIRVLGNTPGGVSGKVFSINDSGIAVGEITLTNGQTEATMTTVHGGLLVGLGAPGSDSVEADFIDDGGNVILSDTTANRYYLYSAGVVNAVESAYTPNNAPGSGEVSTFYEYGATDETISGHNAILAGGVGPAIFNFNLGDGQEVIATTGSQSGSDVLDMGNSFANTTLEADRLGNALRISDSSGDCVVVNSWFSGANQLSLELPNGQTISASTLNSHLTGTQPAPYQLLAG